MSRTKKNTFRGYYLSKYSDATYFMNTVLRLTYGAHILGETYVNLRCGKATCRLGSRPKLNSFDCKKIVPNRKFRRVKIYSRL